MNMNQAVSLIDELLGPEVTHVIDDGQDGEWEISLRPRRTGSPIVRTTAVHFHRPGTRRTNGFGVMLWALQVQAVRPQDLRDPIAECSINFTQTAAQNALAWVDTLRNGGIK